MKISQTLSAAIFILAFASGMAHADGQKPLVAYGCGDEMVRVTDAHLHYHPDPDAGLADAQRTELRGALESAHTRADETIIDLAFAPSCKGFVLLTDRRWIVRNIGEGAPRTDEVQFVDKGGIPHTHFMRDFANEAIEPRDMVASFALDPFRWNSVRNYVIALRRSDKLADESGEPRAIATTPNNDMFYTDLPGGTRYIDLIEAFETVYNERGGEEIATIAFVPRPGSASGWAFLTETGYYHVRGVGTRPYPGGQTINADGEPIESHLFGTIQTLAGLGVRIVDITVAPDRADAPDWMLVDADGCFYANNFVNRIGLSDLDQAEANDLVENPEVMFFQVSEEYHRGSWAEKRQACPTLGSGQDSRLDRFRIDRDRLNALRDLEGVPNTDGPDLPESIQDRIRTLNDGDD